MTRYEHIIVIGRDYFSEYYCDDEVLHMDYPWGRATLPSGLAAVMLS